MKIFHMIIFIFIFKECYYKNDNGKDFRVFVAYKII